MVLSKEIDKRRYLIKEYLLKQPKKTQAEIIKYLLKKDIKVTQSTVHKDLKEIGFKPTTDGYKLSNKKKGAELEEQQLEEVFGFDVPRIHCLPLYTVSIKVNKGTATRIASLIEDKYGDKITGTISGERLVLVYTTHESMAKKISKLLKKLRSNVVKSISPNDEDEEND